MRSRNLIILQKKMVRGEIRNYNNIVLLEYNNNIVLYYTT